MFLCTEPAVSDSLQAPVPVGDATKSDSTVDTLVWVANKISDSEIDNFLMIMRSVGTMGRALDGNSNTKQPGLHVTAAAASRDVTIASGLDILHSSGYDIGKALSEIVAEGPLICRDQMELWTATEAGLFEEALVKYGKDFEEIKKDLVIFFWLFCWSFTNRHALHR